MPGTLQGKKDRTQQVSQKLSQYVRKALGEHCQLYPLRKRGSPKVRFETSKHSETLWNTKYQGIPRVEVRKSRASCPAWSQYAKFGLLLLGELILTENQTCFAPTNETNPLPAFAGLAVTNARLCGKYVWLLYVHCFLSLSSILFIPLMHSGVSFHRSCLFYSLPLTSTHIVSPSPLDFLWPIERTISHKSN